MQVTPPDATLQTVIPTASGVPARILAGNLANVPLGALLQATVTSTTPREAILSVNGQTLTVRPPPGVQLQPGAVFLVRVPATATSAANPTLELAVPANAARLPATSSQSLPANAGRAAAVLPGEVGQTAKATTAPPPAADGAKPTAPASTPPRTALVDVLGSLADGRVRVQIDGQDQIATSAEPLVQGGRYVLQVERTSAGLTLKPPPDSPTLTQDVATAVLRAPASDLGATLKPLQAELATLTAAPADTSTPAVPSAVRNAALSVSTTLQALFPNLSNPPDAAQLQRLIEDGGLHFEAKLARLVTESDSPATPQTTVSSSAQPVSARTITAAAIPTGEASAPATTDPNAQKASAAPTSTQSTTEKPGADTSTPAKPTATPPAPTASTPRAEAMDLKGDLLRLLQAVNDLGGAARVPAAAAALHGIESQQAANAIAQANTTPYFLQIPFPDGGQWRTLRLSLQPENQPDQPDAQRAGRFRVFMHVPLTDLGETWIDAGLAGDKFRATIYLDQSGVRDRVRAALPDLSTELQADGFSEVLLDVRSTSDLPEQHRRQAGAVQAGRPDSVSVLDVKV